MHVKSDKLNPLVRLGIIGTGRMAERMIACAASIPDLRITAVSSSAMGRADVLTEPINAVPCDSAEELAQREDVDAIYVATAMAEHSCGILAAIVARKPVLVEKPFAETLEKSLEIVAAARDAGVLLLENLWFLALPATRSLIDRVNSNEIGQPTNMTFDFGYPVTRAAYPALHAPDLGVVRDRGIYGIAFARHILGPVGEVVAQGHWDGETDVSASILLKHDSGSLSQITVSFQALLSNAATLSCSGGMIRMDPSLGGDTLMMSYAPTQIGPTTKARPSRLTSIPIARSLNRWRKAAKPERYPFGPDPHLPMLAHFCALVRGGQTESLMVPLDLSLDTQRVVGIVRKAIGG
jgi:predicted dehydrogenase